MKNRVVKKHRLKNGLAVFYCHAPDLVSFELSMHINTGARDENKQNSGVSHFLEHMMFRGSVSYPDSFLLSQALEGFGGETNAMTGTEHTSYWLKGDAEKTKEAIFCFAEFFLNPNFADLEIERNVILQEMASDFNEDGTSIDTESLAMDSFFKDHPLGNPVIGTEKAVRHLTQADLQEKRKHFYCPTRCVLTIHSSLDEEQTLAHITSCFEHDWPHASGGQAVRQDASFFLTAPGDLKKAQNALCLQNNPDNQFALKLLFPTAGGLSEQVVLTTFLQRILDDGICTRLPSNIREKHGLVYDISCDTQFFQEIGVFGLDAMVSQDSLEPLLKRLKEEFHKILNHAPADWECDHIKYRYCFDLKQIMENPARLLNREVSAYFANSSFSLQDEMNAVMSFKPVDVCALAQNVFGSWRRGLVLVGPRARKCRDSVESFLSVFDQVF